MKINVEVEIDWVDEESNLDDEVKERVISGIVNSLANGCSGEITKEAEKITKEALAKIELKVDDLTTDLYNSFLDKGVNITDRWGEVVKKDIKVTDIIKDRLDKAMNEKVDDNGRTSDYGKNTRLEYLFDKRINLAVANLTKDVAKQVDIKITETLNASLKTQLSESLLSKIDLPSIIKKNLEELNK